MKTLLSILIAGLLLSACAINEPRVSFGKKCKVADNKVIYSYVWIYDKTGGLPADEKTCKLIEKKK